MIVTPPTPTSGLINLMNVPWDSGYKNVVDFKTDEKRYEYMKTRILRRDDGTRESLAFSDCQYSRRDGILKVPVEIDKLYECNYLMYKNPYYSDKWIYCFVVGQRYVNDNCTELRISTDVYSTWMNSATFHPSFVEREHARYDSIGSNTVPEGLETGEFQCYENYNLTPYLIPMACIAYTGNHILNDTIHTSGGSYNGIPSSIPFLITYPGRIGALMDRINDVNASDPNNPDGQGDKVFACFMIPRLAITTFIQTHSTEMEGNKAFAQLGTTTNDGFSPNYNEPEQNIFTAYKPTTNNGYTPRNKKLLSYPYCYLAFNPPNGSQKIYRWENFLDDEIHFTGISEINPNPTVVIIPQNYMFRGSNIQQAGTVTGYPNVSYKNDYFNTWLAQNSQIVNLTTDRTNFNYEIAGSRNAIAQDRETVNAITNMVTSATAGVASAVTGNIAGTINSVAGGIQSAINSGYNMQELGLNARANAGNWQYDIKSINAQVEKQSMLADTGTLSSSNATLLGYGYFLKACFSLYGLKPEFSEKIDQYFDMFGYQTNLVKVPELKNRLNWNYVKTVNCNITGKIPTHDLNELKSVFDGGVTIWHNPDNIYNYNNTNTIIDNGE